MYEIDDPKPLYHIYGPFHVVVTREHLIHVVDMHG